MYIYIFLPVQLPFDVSCVLIKGVNKLGLSLQQSYLNVRNLLLHHFQAGLQGTLLYLGEVLDMTNRHGQLRSLGLSEDVVQKCINMTGTVGLKSQEMIL